MKCICCGEDCVRWLADNTAEDYGWCDADGIVSELHCDNCGADIIVYVPSKKEGDSNNNEIQTVL